MDGDPFGLGPLGRPAPAIRRLRRAAVALAFWGSIVLPVAYPWALVGGIDTRPELVAFVGLIALHLVAVVVGRNHRATQRSAA